MKQNTKKGCEFTPNFSIPVLGFAAFSGTGKTTLLCEVIPLLRAHGLRLGLVKHSHHAFEMDRPGKDSYRLRHAGASQIVLASNRRSVVLQRYQDDTEPAAFLNQFLQRVERGYEAVEKSEHEHSLDLLLVEGYKYAAIPKIELHRPALGHPLLALNDPYVIAVASDAPLPETPPLSVPLLDINSPAAVAEFIQVYYHQLVFR